MAHLSEPIELDLTDEQAFIVSVFIREGELRERERIIALLEEEASANDDVKNPYDAEYIRALIGIIRGGTA